MLSEWNQHIAAIISTLSVFASGAQFTWMAPLMSKMSQLYNLNAEESSWAVSSIEYGELVFCIPAGLLADKYGRKRVLLSAGPMGVLGWVLVLSSKTVWALYVARITHGLVLGVVFSVVPLYIAEVAEPRVRGALSGQFQMMWAAGLLFTYVVGPYTSFEAYIWLCALLPVLFTAGMAFMPETPYFLVMKGRHAEAEKSLSWLRAHRPCDDEMREIKYSVQLEMKNKASWKDLVDTSKNRRIFLTVQVLCAVKYMIGSPAMSSYAPHTFASHSGGAIGENEATILYGAVLVGSALLGAFLSDKLGRKCLLVGTLFAIGLCYSVTALYFYLAEWTLVPVDDLSWLMYTSIGLAAILSNVGPSTLLQTVQGELFPSNTRALGGAAVGVMSSFATFLDLKQYQTFFDLFGLYSNFVVFAFFSFLGSIFIYCIFKETAGKSLGNIQNDLRTVPE